MKTIVVNQFSGGVVSDPRTPAVNVARTLTNFDALTYPYKIVPAHDSEAGDTAASTSQKQNFCIGNWLPSSTNDWRLFSLGVKSGVGTAEVLMKTLGTLDTGVWLSPTNNQASIGATSFNLFVYYKTQNKIYGAAGGANIWSFDPTGGAWNDSEHGLTYTNIAQGLVHSKDDILYVPYDNKIATNNAGTWTSTVLTLSSKFYITAICEYGNYLAIACVPLSGVGNSVVYLWDRNSTLATMPEVVDWGEGVIQVLEQVNGILVGISTRTAFNSSSTDRVQFKYYNSSGAVMFEQLLATGLSVALPPVRQKYNNRIYFLMSGTFNGEALEGVWSVGQNTGSSTFSIFQERTPYNNVASTGLRGFYIVQDITFISSLDANGNFQLSKTNDQASYTATSILESVINPNMPEGDRIQVKVLNSFGAMYEALPSGAQVVAKYRVDGGAWTTVFTETTTGRVYTEPYSNTSSGVNFTQGKEYEFRFESTGGAVITGYSYKYNILPSNV